MGPSPYRAYELWAMRIQALFVIRFPRNGGGKPMDSSLNARSLSPRSSPSAFMMIFSKAIVAHALCVV